jgi:glutathione S-transferase
MGRNALGTHRHSRKRGAALRLGRNSHAGRADRAGTRAAAARTELRGKALLVADKFCGHGGLAWSRRLQMVHAGLSKTGGFGERVASYLGNKYGYEAARADEYAPRVRTLLRELGAALREQRRAGPYYLGARLTAADIYSATCMAMFMPLPESQCAMHPASRAAFEWVDDETLAAIDPLLLEHRDMMYAHHLELPLSL